MADAFKKVPARAWPTVRDQWLGHLPASIKTALPAPSVEELLSKLTFAENDFLAEAELPGVRKALFAEALFLLGKAGYCCELAVDLNRTGFPTWGGMMMYDASFFAARATCALLGIGHVGGSSKMYFDAFYVRKINAKHSESGFMFFSLPTRLEHSSLWGILDRLLRVVTSSDDLSPKLKRLQEEELDDVSHERNRMMYRVASWSMEDVVHNSDLAGRVGYVKNARSLIGTDDLREMEYFGKYFSLYDSINAVVSHLLVSIGDLAPAVAAVADRAVRRPALA